jgi:steroid 5-alpha reductase family enzyme
MTFVSIYFMLGFIILGIMFLLWLISLALKNSSIVDIFWGMGFVIIAWVTFILTTDGFIPRKLLICIMVTIWGLRLSIHLLVRNWGKPEDYRYQAWRRKAGPTWWWHSYFKVFFLQGVILLIVSVPLITSQISPQPEYLTWLDIIALLIWLIGFFFETVGDWKLARFKGNLTNKGKVLNTGVWRYTRHPNYFGDAAQWWAHYLVAVAAGYWWTIFSPILMTTLLLRVSGVTLIEKSQKEKKPEYKEYIETTSEFIPWFTRKQK